MSDFDDTFPEVALIQQALLDASQIIGEEKLPESIKEAWHSTQNMVERMNARFIRIKRESVKQYDNGRADGFKEGWDADPLKVGVKHGNS